MSQHWYEVKSNQGIVQVMLGWDPPLQWSLFRILCKYLFSEVAVQAVTELDNKAAHCHTPVPQWHRPFL